MRRVFLVGLAVVGVFGLQVKAQTVVGHVGGYAYDVVSIKPHDGDDTNVNVRTTRESYAGSGLTVGELIRYAYQVRMEEQILGLTGPLKSARFDLQAKIDSETMARLAKLSTEERTAARQAMMKVVLEERFKMKAHLESRELPTYALVVAKGGAKVKEADPKDTYPNGLKGPGGSGGSGMMSIQNTLLTAQGVPISTLASSLQGQVQRVVVDKTGLMGVYDLKLQWTPDELQNSQDAGGAASGPSLFTALQEQLGLRLEATKGPVDVVVVDHVEMPSEN